MNKSEIKLVTHPRIKHLTKEDLVRFQLNYILEDYNISEGELGLLTYVYLYGVNAIDYIVKSGILTSSKTAENYISKFRKKGIIQGRGSNTRLHPEITPYLTSIDFQIKLRLLNEKTAETTDVGDKELSSTHDKKDN